MSTLLEAEVNALPSLSEQANGQAVTEDLELVTRSQTGDTSAFEQLFRRYQSDVYQTAYAFMGNTDDAQDMTQEAVVRAYQSLRKFRQESSFRTWITRIVTNLCLDELRKRKRRRTESLDGNPVIQQKVVTQASALDSLIEAEKHEQLQSMLTLLPEKYKALIVLRDVQGYSYNEIADILGCSLGRVKSRLHEARQELKRHFVRRRWI